MEETLMSYKDFLANQTIQVDKVSFVLNLILSGVLAKALAKIYERWGRSISNRTEFSRNFVLLTMTTVFIISIVKSSLALSLGLVGALSIVRFRSAIKEPEELTYLFFCIAIGLGLGADQTLTTLIAFAVVAAVLIGKAHFGKPVAVSNYYLNIKSQGPEKAGVDQFIQTLGQYCQRLSLARLDDHGQEINATFQLEFKSSEDIQKSIDDLKQLNGDIDVSYVDNKGFV